MNLFRFFWTTHKWVGIVLALIVVLIASTGFLLLLKRQSAWIQPPTFEGAAGDVSSFISMQTLFTQVWAAGHPAFVEIGDIDRVDFRPSERVYKVRSEHGFMEMQVCAITGEVLNIATRRSDLLESIHDGSFFAGWVRTYVMPVVAVGLVFLTFSGLWIWVSPIVRRGRQRRGRRQTATAGPGSGP